jgi:hypothetical protein
LVQSWRVLCPIPGAFLTTATLVMRPVGALLSGHDRPRHDGAA